MGELPGTGLAWMFEAALLQQHLEGFFVEVVDAGPGQLTLAHAAHLRLIEAAPVIGKTRPVGL
jgi:hypothetical protein